MDHRKKELVRKFIEQDCEKFAGLLKIYTDLIEEKIPFAPNAEYAAGMAEAVKILREGMTKAEEVAECVINGDYKKLEDLMATEALPPYMRNKGDA